MNPEQISAAQRELKTLNEVRVILDNKGKAPAAQAAAKPAALKSG